MPRRALLTLLAAVAVLLGATAPAQALDVDGLRSTLAALQARMGPASGAYVLDLGTNEPLYARRAELRLVPASNEKLFVTATALLRYGEDAQLTTTVRGAVGDDGVVRGDLALVGGGDPTLGDGELRELARQVAAAGVRRVTGAIVGDESLFDARRGGPDSGYRYDWDLGGSLGALSWRHGRSTAGSPARAAATRFGTFLKAAGVRYQRRPRAGTVVATSAQAQALPDGAPPVLATVTSPAIARLAADINVPSENFYAEMLVKSLGASFGRGGSTAGGLAVVREAMTPLGVLPRMVDGSGLSRANRTTAYEVVRLLAAMDRQDVAPAWRASLPVAGRSGTIRMRMRGTAAQTRCSGKTGTLTGVSALSGYCTTAGGRRVAFSLIENRVCSSCAKDLENRMVAAIARLR